MVGPLASTRAGRIALGALAVLVAAGASCGCVTLGKFEQLEARVAELELERERLQASMEEDVRRLENLHAKLTEAEETLRKSGTNLGIRVEQLEATQPTLTGQLEAAAFQLKSLARDMAVVKKELFERLGATSVYLPTEMPKDADGVWALAQTRAKAGQVPEARAVFDYFEASYPTDPRADDALMELGRLAEVDGDSTEAIKRYQAVHDRYPEGDQVPRALFRIGELLEARGDCKRAKGVYEYLQKGFGKSAEGRKAKDRITAVQRDCREK